ncbi:MAG: ArsR/SmtB family transcription factor [Fervidobacterium pennivorans]
MSEKEIVKNSLEMLNEMSKQTNTQEDIKDFDFEKLAEILKILGHPTRLKIINALEDGPKCVCNLIPIIKVNQANLSQHLSLLKLIGVVFDKRIGNTVEYHLSKDHPLLKHIIACINENLSKKEV